MIKYLFALSVKAAPVADYIRELMNTDESLRADEGLKLFLKGVEKGLGPSINLP